MTAWAHFILVHCAQIGHIRSMKLIDHLKASEKTVSAFAAEIGETVNTVRKIVYGQRQPSLPLAVKIAAATGGQVTEADLVIDAPEAA